MRFAICNEIYKGWSLPDTFRHARAAGYDAVEIAPFTLAKSVGLIPPARRAEIRQQAAEAGVALSAIHWVLVETEGLHVTSPDPVVRARTARYFVDLVDFGADLGAPCMVVGSPKQRNLLPGVTNEQGWAWAADVFRPAVARARDRGFTICFEPLAPSETNFINTARDAYFHANDANLKGPGFGDVDFVPIARALRDVGYDGTVSVEVFRFEEGPEAIATRSRAYLREAFGC